MGPTPGLRSILLRPRPPRNHIPWSAVLARWQYPRLMGISVGDVGTVVGFMAGAAVLVHQAHGLAARVVLRSANVPDTAAWRYDKVAGPGAS